MRTQSYKTLSLQQRALPVEKPSNSCCLTIQILTGRHNTVLKVTRYTPMQKINSCFPEMLQRIYKYKATGTVTRSSGRAQSGPFSALLPSQCKVTRPNKAKANLANSPTGGWSHHRFKPPFWGLLRQSSLYFIKNFFGDFLKLVHQPLAINFGQNASLIIIPATTKARLSIRERPSQSGGYDRKGFKQFFQLWCISTCLRLSKWSQIIVQKNQLNPRVN